MCGSLRSRLLVCTALSVTVGVFAAGFGMVWAVGASQEMGVDQQSMAQILGNLISVASLGVAAVATMGAKIRDRACKPEMADMVDFQGLQSLRHSSPQAGAGHSLPAHFPANVLFDETGRMITAADLPTHLRYPDPDFDLIAYAVRNMGMVHLCGRSVRLHPATVDPDALEAACCRLAEMAGGPIRVSALMDGAWRITVHASPWAAMQEMIGLWHGGDAPKESAFSAAPTEIDGLTGHMHGAFAVWRDCGGEMAEGAINQLRAIGAWDRAVALCPTKASNTGFAFAHIGAGITAFGDRWRREMVGKADDGQPDPIYAAAVSRLYCRSLSSGLPAANRVTARLRVAGGDHHPLRYRQLLLPWTVTHGATRSTVLTSITQRVEAIPATA